jgi:oligo-1,6-glucosidase
VIHSHWGHRRQIYGDFEDLSEGEEEIFVFTRTLESSKALILLNFSEDEQIFSLPTGMSETTMTLLLGNYDDPRVISTASRNEVRLRAYEGCLYINGR